MATTANTTTITSTTRKDVTLNLEVKDGDKVVMGKTATIDSTTGNINFSEWVNDMPAYKENRVEIRKLVTEFEDTAFSDQDNLNGGSK